MSQVNMNALKIDIVKNVTVVIVVHLLLNMRVKKPEDAMSHEDIIYLATFWSLGLAVHHLVLVNLLKLR
jgi:hypothetical protein